MGEGIYVFVTVGQRFAFMLHVLALSYKKFSSFKSCICKHKLIKVEHEQQLASPTSVAKDRLLKSYHDLLQTSLGFTNVRLFHTCGLREAKAIYKGNDFTVTTGPFVLPPGFQVQRLHVGSLWTIPRVCM
eukprot:2984179-Amphidinium_carterae.1